MPPRRPPTAQDLAREVRRQLHTEAARHGAVQEFERLRFRARAGTLFQPRVIVAALFALGGGALVACSGIVAWFLHHR